MKVVVDTNVFVSGIYFSGPPFLILDAWRNGHLTLVTTSDILEEYRRVGQDLAVSYPGVDAIGWLALVEHQGQFIEAFRLSKQVCTDPDDDKFIACAMTAGCRVIISGDRHLLDVDGYESIKVMTPRSFVDHYLAH